MRRIAMALSLGFFVLVGSVYSLAEAGDACADLPPADWNDARVDNIDLDRQTITLTNCKNDRHVCEGTSKTCALGTALRSEGKALSHGDHVTATFDTEEKPVSAEKTDKKDAATPAPRPLKKEGTPKNDKQDKKDQNDKAKNQTSPSIPGGTSTLESNQAKEQLPQLKSIRVRCGVTSASKRFWTLFLILAALFL